MGWHNHTVPAALLRLGRSDPTRWPRSAVRYGANPWANFRPHRHHHHSKFPPGRSNSQGQRPGAAGVQRGEAHRARREQPVRVGVGWVRRRTNRPLVDEFVCCLVFGVWAFGGLGCLSPKNLSFLGCGGGGGTGNAGRRRVVVRRVGRLEGICRWLGRGGGRGRSTRPPKSVPRRDLASANCRVGCSVHHDAAARREGLA